MPAPSQRNRRRARARLLSSSAGSIPGGGMPVKKSTVPATLNSHFGGPLMNAEELFLANIATIDRIAALICSHHPEPNAQKESASQRNITLPEHKYEKMNT